MMECSFCGKGGDAVEVLITGPDVAICDECVKLCMDIVTEHTAREAIQKAQRAAFYELWGTD